MHPTSLIHTHAGTCRYMYITVLLILMQSCVGNHKVWSNTQCSAPRIQIEPAIYRLSNITHSQSSWRRLHCRDGAVRAQGHLKRHRTGITTTAGIIISMRTLRGGEGRGGEGHLLVRVCSNINVHWSDPG